MRSAFDAMRRYRRTCSGNPAVPLAAGSLDRGGWDWIAGTSPAMTTEGARYA